MAWSDLDDARVAADTPENHLADHNALHALANDFHDSNSRTQHVRTTAKGGNDANTGWSWHDPVATVAQAQTNLNLDSTDAGIIKVDWGRYSEQVLLTERQHLWGRAPSLSPNDAAKDPEKQVIFQAPDGANWEYIIGVGPGVGTGNATGEVDFAHGITVKNITVYGRRDLSGVSAVQRITNSGGTGTFTLTFEQNTVSEETAAISASAAAVDVESALEALTHIENVTCTGGPLNSAPVDVTFTDRKAVLNDMTVDNTGMSGGTVSVSTTTAGTGPTAEAGVWVHQLGENSLLDNIRVHSVSGWAYRYSGAAAGGVNRNQSFWNAGAGGGAVLFNEHQDALSTRNGGHYFFENLSGDENNWTKSVVMRVEGTQKLAISNMKLEGWDVICDIQGTATQQDCAVVADFIQWGPDTGVGANLTVHRRHATCQALFHCQNLSTDNTAGTIVYVDDTARDAQAQVLHNPTGPTPTRSSQITYGFRNHYIPAGNNWTGELILMGTDQAQLWLQQVFESEDPWRWWRYTTGGQMEFINKDTDGFLFHYDDQGGTTDDLLTVNRVSGVPHTATGVLSVEDGVTAPSAISGQALIYVDSADGDLKVKFGDGTVATIAVDT